MDTLKKLGLGILLLGAVGLTAYMIDRQAPAPELKHDSECVKEAVINGKTVKFNRCWPEKKGARS